MVIGLYKNFQSHVDVVAVVVCVFRVLLLLFVFTEPDADSDVVLREANTMLQTKHGITQSTLQVEGYQDAMDECGTCREPERKSFLQSLVPSFLSRSSTVPQNC